MGYASRKRISAADHLVVSVIGTDAAMFELAISCEVFGIDRSYVDAHWYRHLICAVEPGLIDVGNGTSLQVTAGLEALDDADTIVIPGWDEDVPDGLVRALQRAHTRGARILSVCTGAFPVAAAGLLDGQKATTHWRHAQRLAEAYPSIDVDPSVLYVDNGQVMTSAGSAAGIDLFLHVVRLDHGAEIANTVARGMVVPPHRDGGQAQYVQTPMAACNEDSMALVLDWALEHLDAPLTVETLAREANVSPRTLARRFKDATGTTPLQWLLSQRIALAQRLLETTDDPIERVAEQAGFGSAAALRVHFQRAVAASPLAYRRTFRQSDDDEAAAG